MENQNRALRWIADRFDLLGAKIQRYNWIEALFPDLVDVSVRIQVRGRTHFGWGADENEDLALLKAFSEALERESVQHTDASTSNGFSAHTSFEAAQVAAERELRERDLFFCHYLTSTPFSPLTPPKSWLWLPRVQEWATQNELWLGLFEVTNTGALCIIHGLDRRRPFGLALGSSIRETQESAAINAIIEASRKVCRILSTNEPPSSIKAEEFRKLPSPKFADHGKLALDIVYAKSVLHLFPSSSSLSPKHTLPVASPSIEVKSLEIPLQEYRDCPITFVRATSSDVQQLFLGTTTPGKVNFERLSAFAGHPIAYERLNPIPHFFD